MKRFTLVAAAALMAISAPAFAIPLSIVGGVDKLIDQDRLGNSGDGSERAFIADALHLDASSLPYSHLSDTASGGSSWVGVDGSSSLFAFDFGSLSLAPTYFLIKVGSGVGLAGDGSSATFSHYLYQNVSSTNYGVIDLSAFDRTGDRKVNIGLVSHVSTIGGAKASVPEPTMLSLFGLALAGLGFAFRRKRAARAASRET